MATVTPLNESNFQSLDGMSMAVELARVNSVTYTIVNATFTATTSVYAFLNGVTLQKTVTITYVDQNKVSTLTLSIA